MIKTYKEYFPLYKDDDHFIFLITGGRGSGKSFGVSTFIERLTFELFKDTNKDDLVHNILYTRYTMVSAGISVIPEFWEKVELDGTEKYFHRTKTDIINKMTGARIMFRGIHTSSGNQTAKLKSIHGITTLVVDEAEEWMSEEEFDKIVLSIRKQGIKNRVIIIMNPSDSNHFIYKKYIEKTHKIVEYDGVPVQISTHPNVCHIHVNYQTNAEHLSPDFIREVEALKESDPEKYAHVIMGRWDDVAEGAVFKNWGIVDEFPEYAEKQAISVDWGYTNDSTAILRCGVVGNRLYAEEKCYKTHLTSAELIKELKAAGATGENGLFVYADSADPRLIDEIALAGIIIYPVQKGAGSILAGITKMQSMEMFVTKGSTNLQSELRNYVWEKDKDGNYINQPIDKYNHCFVGSTLITTNKGEKRIDEVRPGDVVFNSGGWHKVRKTFDNGIKDIVKAVITTNHGIITIEATDSHKIKTTNGWKQLKDLKAEDIIYLCKCSTEKSSTSIETSGITQEAQQRCTELCGSSIMEQSRKGMTSTILTKTPTTTIFQTSHLLKLRSIRKCTCASVCKTLRLLKNLTREWTTQESLQTSGTAQMRGESGIGSMLKKLLRTFSPKSLCARIVARSSTESHSELIGSAQTDVRQSGVSSQALTTKQENALCAGLSSCVTSTFQRSAALGNVQKPLYQLQPVEITAIEIKTAGSANVYNMEVEDVHEYVANGMLVSNCIDSWRYYCLGKILGKIMKPRAITKADLGIM